MDRLGVVTRLRWRPPPGRLARYIAPAAFLIAVTGVVLVVRSTLRSTQPASSTVPAIASRVATAPATTRPTAPKRYYVISSGDTLGAIAAQFATTVDELLRLNPAVEPTALRPGEQIRIR
jgi:LysM repeat protein